MSVCGGEKEEAVLRMATVSPLCIFICLFKSLKVSQLIYCVTLTLLYIETQAIYMQSFL